ncbi:MAG: VF530 family protein [Bacteroidota bacterium]
MSDDINYKNNPLHGLSLKNMLIALVDHYGFEILFAYLNIKTFDKNPSIDSSVKFLKKTDWARKKVEGFYLYQYKSLPRCSDEQFELAPRDRIVPDDQTPGAPAELSLEDAQRLHEKRARKAANRDHRRFRPNENQKSNADKPQSRIDSGNTEDPWAAARAKHKQN